MIQRLHHANNYPPIIVLLLLTYCFTPLFAMKPAQKALNLCNTMIWVQPCDSDPITYKRDAIKPLKLLQVMLEHQKGSNSKENPIDAYMINAQEFALLKKALHAIRHNNF